MRKNIGTKIILLVGFCLALLGVVAGTSVWQMNKIGIEIEGIAERDLPLTKGLTQIAIHQLEQAVNFERAIRTGEELKEHSASRKEFEKSSNTFKSLSKKIEKEFIVVGRIATSAFKNSKTKKERLEFGNMAKELKKLEIEHKDYDHLALEAFGYLQAGNIAKVMVLLPKIEAEEEDLDHGLEKLLIEIENFTEHAAITAEHHEKFALKLMMIISVFALAIGLGTAVYIVKRSISRPLKEIVAGIDALVAGDTSVEVTVYHDDEIGAVAKSYQTFKETTIRANDLEKTQEEEKLKQKGRDDKLMRELANDFESTVGGIITSVSAASTELNSTAQSMASISEETSSQATAVAAVAEQTSTNVQMVADATTEMKSSITEISTQVVEASVSSKKAVDDVSKTATQMKSLAQTADKIGSVVSMISDIAEQTNLLALNATIESARAGEAGKGFAVVAGEVKALASETAKATENISQLIGEIQSATGEAVISIDSIGKVIAHVEETSSSIAAAMEEQGATTQEVVRNVSEAASGTREVSSNMSGLKEASQEAGAAASQVSSASDELSQQAETLKYEVTKFLENMRKGAANRRQRTEGFAGPERREGESAVA